MLAASGERIKPVQDLHSHTGSILCCAASSRSPSTVFSSSEDGSVCVFDLRSGSCSMRLQSFGAEPIASVCLNPGNDNELFAAPGAVVYMVDLRAGSSSGRELLQKYEFNLDDINQVVVNHKATYLAAADDSGEVKIIDLRNHKLYRTLRGVHTSICSAVQFHLQKPWEIISGGLDSKIVKWDFSKGKKLASIDVAANNGIQLCNPPFVHAIAIPESQGSGEAGRLVAVARGDGVVEVYDSGFMSEHKSSRTECTRRKKGKDGKNSMRGVDEDAGGEAQATRVNGLRRHLDSEQGGHLTAVSYVTFANFGERGRYILSGANDKLIKLWDWCSLGEPLVLNILHGKKVNWLATTDRSSGNVLVADTSEVLSVYHVL